MIASTQRYILMATVIVLVAAFFLFNLSPSGFFHNQAEWPYGLRLVKDNVEYRVYANMASWLEKGTLPYKDVKEGYPQIAVLYLSWPNIFANNFSEYQKSLLVSNLVCFFLLIYVTILLLKSFQKNLHLIWFLFLPNFLYFVLNRYDILPALVVQWTVYFMIKRKYSFVFLLLAINFFIKWYALILLPVVIIYICAKEKNYRQIIKKGLTRFFIVLFVVFSASLLLFGEKTFSPYLLHMGRGWEIGSFFYLFWQYTTFLENPWASLLFLAIIFLMQFAPLLYLAINFYFHGLLAVAEKFRNHKNLMTWFCLLVIFFIAFAKFYSGQWMLWLTPLLILQINSKKELFLIIILDIINYLQFPVLYDSLWIHAWPFDLVVLIRSLLLFWLMYVLIKKTRTPVFGNQ